MWLETPSNPLLRIGDLRAVADLVHRARPGAWPAVDNTFATPYLQRPLELGADLVRSSELHERLAFLQNAVGAVPGPLDCFLVLRGIKTLAVRMNRHAQNAAAVAEYLAAQPQVERVIYAFHLSHPQHDMARRRMRNGGGMVSFTLRGGAAVAVRAVERTRVFALAESLGGVESLIEIPAVMTHASTAGSPIAVEPGLIRLSVGLENVEDLVEDLRQALLPG